MDLVGGGIEAVLPTEEDDRGLESSWYSVAYYGISSIAYVVDACVNDADDNACWAAEQAYNMADDLAISSSELDFNIEEDKRALRDIRALKVTIQGIMAVPEIASVEGFSIEAILMVSQFVSVELALLVRS